ncbi:negative regulator of dna transposition [Lentinula edodes]|uniref:Negative regulator of dna transposition n=1 Tax=Lentinula edodes TaxID=5353 RepID=A0A1Q3E0F8_LENED|nr:negative regulator of dna transposition [Lentinula edodes]
MRDAKKEHLETIHSRFSCEYEPCPESYASKQSCDNHILTVHLGIHYQCNGCTASFTSEGALCRHLYLYFSSHYMEASVNESSQSASRQILVQQKLGELISHHSESSEPKRGRDSGGENESMMMMKKRQKLSVDNDLPQYTLHSLSITSPICKKVDITIHERTVRTRTSGEKGKGVMVNDDKEKEQIIFGLDATMNESDNTNKRLVLQKKKRKKRYSDKLKGKSRR